MKGVSSATDGMAKEIKNATKDMDGLSDEAQDLAIGMDDDKDGTRSATSDIRGLGNSATKTSLDIGENGTAFGSVGNIVGNVLGVALNAVSVSFEIAAAAAGAFVATVSTLTVASV